MNKKIAFCYDFDGTLSSGNMQEQNLLPDCNIAPETFWREVIETSKNIKADPVLMYMHLLLEKMKKANIPSASHKNLERLGLLQYLKI